MSDFNKVQSSRALTFIAFLPEDTVPFLTNLPGSFAYVLRPFRNQVRVRGFSLSLEFNIELLCLFQFHYQPTTQVIG